MFPWNSIWCSAIKEIFHLIYIYIYITLIFITLFTRVRHWALKMKLGVVKYDPWSNRKRLLE